MLIDSAHLEEIRVAVVDGDKLDKFDFASPSKVQIKGNIYLGKIVRVEPSLQAAFVDFGGDKHGFLSFSEIHHDYFQIPVSDREELEARIQEAMAAHTDDEGEADEDIDSREISRLRYQFYRRYKIQEVIKKRQIVLVQVTKEARGVKGAALTTYISLAGRYCVLMPNMSKGSGVSRKISNPKDRMKMKKIVSELNIENGSTVIRTAGVGHTKLEIRKDFEYLKKLWDEIRGTTLKSTAPSLIYEEANIIKRAIRDLYSRDVESIVVEGEAGYKFTKDLVRKLMPSHAKKVKLYDDKKLPLFSKFNINEQVNQIYSTRVDLPSGGYLVINPTEALVSIDVNSGKSTRARDIAGTAIKTNLEAAVEIARQCRLRDLAGLIVVDFIDMEDKRSNNQVERCLREALREDKARIQVGAISNFGLLEFSRQRLRSSIADANMVICPHCSGTGFIWSDESIALQILRKIEETCMALDLSEVTVTLSTDVALYLLNNKKDFISSIEKRGLKVKFAIDPTIAAVDFKIAHVMKPVSSDDDESQQPSEEKTAEHNNGRNHGKSSNRYSRRPTPQKSERNVSTDESKEDNITQSSAQRRDNKAKNPEIKPSEQNEKSQTYSTRRKNWRKKKDTDDSTSSNTYETSSKAVFNISAKKLRKNEAESEEKTPSEEAHTSAVIDESSINFVSEKDIGSLIETYREAEKGVKNPPKKADELMPTTNKKKGKKSGWWQKLLKPTNRDDG